MDTLASRYAAALLMIAKEEGKNEVFREEIRSLLSAFEACDELKKMLSSSFIDKMEKKKVFEEVLKNETYYQIRDFILVIIDNSRERELFSILREFISLSNREDGIAEGIVYSTERLSDSEIDKITLAVERKLGKKISLHNRLDGSLIGGVKVIVDGFVFDGSIRNKLAELKRHLEKGENA